MASGALEGFKRLWGAGGGEGFRGLWGLGVLMGLGFTTYSSGTLTLNPQPSTLNPKP